MGPPPQSTFLSRATYSKTVFPSPPPNAPTHSVTVDSVLQACFTFFEVFTNASSHLRKGRAMYVVPWTCICLMVSNCQRTVRSRRWAGKQGLCASCPQGPIAGYRYSSPSILPPPLEFQGHPKDLNLLDWSVQSVESPAKEKPVP